MSFCFYMNKVLIQLIFQYKLKNMDIINSNITEMQMSLNLACCSSPSQPLPHPGFHHTVVCIHWLCILFISSLVNLSFTPLLSDICQSVKILKLSLAIKLHHFSIYTAWKYTSTCLITGNKISGMWLPVVSWSVEVH